MTRLLTYLDTGTLPSNHLLTPEQCEAIAHSAVDEPTAAIAQRINAEYFATYRYRARLFGVLSTKLNWRRCDTCGVRFAAQHAGRKWCASCEWQRLGTKRLNCLVHFRECLECGNRFAARRSNQLMHDGCRRRVDRRIAHRQAA